jgi:hypothetical protein
VNFQLLLEVARAILAAAIRMREATLEGVAQVYGHLERPDAEVFLHPVASRPTDPATTEQIDDDGQIEPAFGGPDVADIAVQQVGSNAEGGMAIRRNLSMRSRWLVACDAHGRRQISRFLARDELRSFF